MATTRYSITAVVNNEEKRRSYKENFERYKKAEKSGFYFECLWILYAMLEDRASAFLYHLGFTSSKNAGKVVETKKIKAEIRQLFSLENNNTNYNFVSISGKLSRIDGIFRWNKTACDDASDYQKALRKALAKVSSDETVVNSVNYLNDEWREKRNQLVHSLFNKSYNAVNDELKLLVENGYTAIRDLDSAVKKVKAVNIRREFNIQ